MRDTLIMAGKANDDAASAASDNLSQLAARILNQLAISAWLPSAALVLLLAVVLSLGAAIDESSRDRQAVLEGSASFASPLVVAFEKLGSISLASILLLLAAIVVMTMVTQAFSFEAIRILEGYWGTGTLREHLAQRRCLDFRDRRRELKKQERELTGEIARIVKRKIERMQLEALARDPEADQMSPRQIRAVGRRVKDLKSWDEDLDPDELAVVADFRWRDFAPGELSRRLTNVQRRLEDFPNANRLLPTRLGNILRRFEDDTGSDSVTTLVSDVFDDLPFSIQIAHDEQRGRLDLYCSMTFVWCFVTVIAVVRFAFSNPVYAAGAAAVGVVSAWFTYRAAMASARHYGLLLVSISQYPSRRAAVVASDDPSAIPETEVPVPSRQSRRIRVKRCLRQLLGRPEENST